MTSTPTPTSTLPRKSAKKTPKKSCEPQAILRHWQQAVPDDRFAHLVKDATRSFQRSLQMRLVQHGVPFGHWTFLRALWERDGITQKQLSDEAGVMEPTTLMAVRAMETKGWVERRQHADNRKNVHIYLTESGHALKAVLVPLAETVNGLGLGDLPDDDIAVARKVLLAIITNLARDVTGEGQ